MQPPSQLRPDSEEQSSIRNRVRTWMVSGIAITVPFLVTLLVFRFAMDFLLNSVGPLARLFRLLGVDSQYAPEVAALLTLVSIIFVIGFLAETSRASRRFEAAFDNAMSSIPGLGAVYSSFNEMSQLLIDSDTQSFQEVKLVEYPTQGSYCVAFVTAETSNNIREATGNPEMTTLYLPMAPNPVMGGFVVHVEKESVYDVDMTVEEGMRSVVTSGVAVNTTDDDPGADQIGGANPSVSEDTPVSDQTSM